MFPVYVSINHVTYEKFTRWLLQIVYNEKRHDLIMLDLGLLDFGPGVPSINMD